MLFGETVAVYCENHTEHTDTLCGQNVEFWALEGYTSPPPYLFTVCCLLMHMDVTFTTHKIYILINVVPHSVTGPVPGQRWSPNSIAKGMITCCVAKAIAHLSGWWWMGARAFTDISARTNVNLHPLLNSIQKERLHSLQNCKKK
jgi:hypothetical protein